MLQNFNAMKTFIIISAALAALLIITIIALYFSGPQLPGDIEEKIEEVLKSDLPELVKGKTGYVYPENTKVWYESIDPAGSSQGSVLLFMGIANDALGWPQGFVDSLVEAGYQVIRYDYRGTGMSDWMPKWKQSPYSLKDLAEDATLILDTLKIEKAHLIGISMGGMVAQEFAIHYPERTLTLASLMSSGDIADKAIGGISKSITYDLIKIGLKYGILSTERNIIKMNIAARIILRGTSHYSIDIMGSARQVLYSLRKRNGYNPRVSSQHEEAVQRSGSRYEALKDLKVPALIIHGINDPFVSIEHSKKLASVLPDAKTRWIEDIGHDIPPTLHKSLIAEMIDNFKRRPN